MDKQTTKSIYAFLDAQTYDQRRAFVKKLNERGFSKQQISNWISKRQNFPIEKQSIVCELAGEPLLFPKLKRFAVIEPA